MGLRTLSSGQPRYHRRRATCGRVKAINDMSDSHDNYPNR